MDIYSKFIYPALLERSMTKQSIMNLRKELLSEVNEEVLEIGFGTGLNLDKYPNHISKITVIDTNEVFGNKAKERIDKSSIQVDFKYLSAEKLPFEDGSFDSIVSTFTLCSIPDIKSAISEFYRVLKPKGKLFFLEHGKSPDKKVRFFQNLINPFFKAASCSLTRDIKALIEGEGFDIIKINGFYQEDAMKILGYLYMGVGQK